jgi:hypothetical protein
MIFEKSKVIETGAVIFETCNGGTWENGIWEDGEWINGVWKDGIWEDGTWEQGWIYDPNKKGNYEDNWKWDGDYVHSLINPKEYFNKKK